MITEDHFLDFQCPECGALNSFPQESAGFVRECVNCMEAVIVPEDGSEAGRKIPIPLTTSKLVLRRPTFEDLKDFARLKPDHSEDDLMRWLSDDCQVKLTAVDRPFHLGIESREEGKIIGSVSLQFSDREFSEVGIVAGWDANAERQVLVGEALVTALGFCFKELKVHRVFARCESHDAVACQLYAAAGMRREGEFVKHYRVAGEWFNTVWFAMLDEEFREADSIPGQQSSS